MLTCDPGSQTSAKSAAVRGAHPEPDSSEGVATHPDQRQLWRRSAWSGHNLDEVNTNAVRFHEAAWTGAVAIGG